MRNILRTLSFKSSQSFSSTGEGLRSMDIGKTARFSLLVLFCFSLSLFAANQLCKFTFTACPENFNGDTIDVPPTVVALSQYIYACKSDSIISGTGTGTGGIPSIMFVIDNSGSMKGSNGNDPDGSRFTVTRALLDTIYKTQPSAEVGLIVFREHLFFDTSSTEYYADYFKTFNTVIDGEPYQAYLPFIKLNQTYGTRLGINIIKDILTTNADTLLYHPEYRTLRPNTGGGETNINGAFIAVKQAMAAAKNPKDRQFVIFLSDGEPAGTTQAGLANNYYEGGDSVPTTFTVFFTSSTTAPASLTNMTNNIKTNGYSATNPNSALWTIQTSFNSLLNLFMINVMPTILVGGNPISMQVNGGVASTRYVNGSFVFTDSFPLSPGITHFSLNIAYRYTDKTTGAIKDTFIPTDFYVRKQVGATVPSGVNFQCWDLPITDIPVTVTLFDTSGDGHIDKLDIVWTDTSTIKPGLTLDEVISSLNLTTLSGSTVGLHPVSITLDLANKTIHVMLTENTGAELETGWRSTSVNLTPVPVNVNQSAKFSVSSVLDGTGPVISKAQYLPAGLDNSPTAWDTLVIIMSEPVLCQELVSNGVAASFNYYDSTTLSPGALAHAQFVTQCINSTELTTTFRIATLRSDIQIVPGEDKIQLVSGTHDAAGNPPPVNGRKCPIEWGGTSGIRMGTGPDNPSTPGVTLLPPVVQTFYSGIIQDLGGKPAYGTIVGIQSVKPLVSTSDGVYGKATIFDGIGNIVRKDLPIKKANTNDREYGLFWDGRNRNGRFVGSGTYLVIVTVKDTDGKTQTSRIKIGISRIGKN